MYKFVGWLAIAVVGGVKAIMSFKEMKESAVEEQPTVEPKADSKK